MSEALLFSEQWENMLCAKIVLNVENNFCTQHVLSRFELGIFMYWTCNSMNNMLSHCGLVNAKIRASDKDLPVTNHSNSNGRKCKVKNSPFMRASPFIRHLRVSQLKVTCYHMGRYWWKLLHLLYKPLRCITKNISFSL